MCSGLMVDVHSSSRQLEVFRTSSSTELDDVFFFAAFCVILRDPRAGSWGDGDDAAVAGVGDVLWSRSPMTVPQVLQMNCVVRQTTEEIRNGVQHVPSKRMQERDGDSNIKGLDKYNMPLARVVSDKMYLLVQSRRDSDVGGQEQVIVREIPEMLVVERIQEQIHDRYLEDVKKAFAGWDKRSRCVLVWCSLKF